MKLPLKTFQTQIFFSILVVIFQGNIFPPPLLQKTNDSLPVLIHAGKSIAGKQNSDDLQSASLSLFTKILKSKEL